MESKEQTLIVNLFAGPGAGKCFSRDIAILMHDGTTKLSQDIVIGDSVMGRDGTARKVVKLFRGIDHMYQVTPVKGSPFNVTRDHKLVLDYTKANSKELLLSPEEILELSNSKQSRLKLKRSELIEFDFSDVKIDPYFLGIWLGDGHSDNQIVTTADLEIKNYLTEYGDSLGLSTKVHAKKGSAYSYSLSVPNTWTKNPLRQSLTKYSLKNNKHIPKEYLTNHSSIRLQLLAGLIDSDGWVDSNCVFIVQKRKKLAEDITFLARSLGFATYIRKINKTCVNNGVVGEYWNVSVSGDLSIIPTKLKRKQFSPRKQVKNTQHTGFSLNYLGLQNYYGFELDGDHIHLLGDFTLTHNSSYASGIQYRLKVSGYNSEYIQEYAKDKTWSEDKQTLLCQPYVTGKQFYRTTRIMNKVEVAVTDSPILTGILYQQKKSKHFESWVVEAFKECNNLNFFLVRNTEHHPYNPAGRSQSLEEAIAKDKEMKDVLDKYDIPYFEVPIQAVDLDTWSDPTLDFIYSKIKETLIK